jgi:hypothetical protein
MESTKDSGSQRIFNQNRPNWTHLNRLSSLNKGPLTTFEKYWKAFTLDQIEWFWPKKFNREKTAFLSRRDEKKKIGKRFSWTNLKFQDRKYAAKRRLYISKAENLYPLRNLASKTFNLMSKKWLFMTQR